MSQTPDQDVRMFERTMRVEAHHVEGADPSLCYVAVYTTDPVGQWLLLTDWTLGPFDDADRTGEIERYVRTMLAKILR